MFEYIGEQIRANVLVNLTWVSRSAGYVEPIRVQDGDKVRLMPGAKPYAGAVCESGDYINMAPDAGQTCIVFVDSDEDVFVTRKTSRYSEIDARFRVVVWYDERKISISAGEILVGMQSAIIAGVRAVSFNTEGLMLTKTFFQNFQHDPERVWSRYGLHTHKKGLFVAPYKTFAVTFRMIGRFVPECFTGVITADADAC